MAGLNMCVRLCVCISVVKEVGDREKQSRRGRRSERRVGGRDGPHALNLNLMLTGRGGEGRGQVLSAAGNGKAKVSQYPTCPCPLPIPSLETDGDGMGKHGLNAVRGEKIAF